MFPRFMMVGVEGDSDSAHYAVYKNEGDGTISYELGSVSPFTNIEVELALADQRYVHLRFTRSNRYWSAQDGVVVAQFSLPEEDATSPSCTLFEATAPDQNGLFHLIHVQSRGYVQMDGSRFLVKDASLHKLQYMDWDTIVKLPQENVVAFRGDNGKYLQVIHKDGHHYLQFSSEDPSDEASAHKITQYSDGTACRLRGSGISADAGSGKGGYFWPVKTDDSTIALLNLGANRFCSRLTAEGSTDCLNANVTTLPNVPDWRCRSWCVTYEMVEGRISNEEPYIAGYTMVVNDSAEEALMAVEITYQDDRSYTFTRS